MKTIQLTRGQFTLVDSDIYEYLSQWKWYAEHRKIRFYAATTIHSSTCFMHHLVLGITRLPRILGLHTDHIDGNSLNNQRLNLRLCTVRQNHANQQRHRDGKLVGAHRSGNTWGSFICVKGKDRRLGTFQTEREAHERYIEELKSLNEPLPISRRT